MDMDMDRPEHERDSDGSSSQSSQSSYTPKDPRDTRHIQTHHPADVVYGIHDHHHHVPDHRDHHIYTHESTWLSYEEQLKIADEINVPKVHLDLAHGMLPEELNIDPTIATGAIKERFAYELDGMETPVECASVADESDMDCTESDEEGLKDYRMGGYHYVQAGEIYFGRYRIEAKLGWGHFSTVWLATDLLANPLKYVAVKFQRASRHYGEAAYDEMEILRTIRRRQDTPGWDTMTDEHLNILRDFSPLYHTPGIVEFIDWFNHKGPNGKHVCIVFECMGPSLLSLIKYYDYKPAPIESVRIAARDLLVGLDFLHRHCGIIHTDLKPENILLSAPDLPPPRPPSPRVQDLLTDIHLAKKQIRDNELSRLPKRFRKLAGRDVIIRADGSITTRQAKLETSSHVNSPSQIGTPHDTARNQTYTRTPACPILEDDLLRGSPFLLSGKSVDGGDVSALERKRLKRRLKRQRAKQKKKMIADVTPNEDLSKTPTSSAVSAPPISTGNDPAPPQSTPPTAAKKRKRRKKKTIPKASEPAAPPYVRHGLRPSGSDPSLLSTYKCEAARMSIGFRPPYHYATYKAQNPEEFVTDNGAHLIHLPKTTWTRSLPDSPREASPAYYQGVEGQCMNPAMDLGEARSDMAIRNTRLSASGGEYVTYPRWEVPLDLPYPHSNPLACPPLDEYYDGMDLFQFLLPPSQPSHLMDGYRPLPVPSRTHRPPNSMFTTLHSAHGPFSLKDFDTIKCRSDLRFKIVDLGNACWEDQHFSDDIQTRQYRSPEVLVQHKYDSTADMWSLACLLFELATGDYLFEPKSATDYSRDDDHIALITELLGNFPDTLRSKGKNSHQFFSSSGKLKHINELRYWPVHEVLMQKYHLSEKDSREFGDFLLPMLQVDPRKRASARDMLKHPWLTEASDEKSRGMALYHDSLRGSPDLIRRHSKDDRKSSLSCDDDPATDESRKYCRQMDETDMRLV
eukprot:GHVO01003998.1.p1 GENE.GHVO01003998.1~~GHVO01003998.1.p1  ORF type:complete len:968 (+),score=198.28 GHVO01003998.1:2-2905(+)